MRRTNYRALLFVVCAAGGGCSSDDADNPAIGVPPPLGPAVGAAGMGTSVTPPVGMMPTTMTPAQPIGSGAPTAGAVGMPASGGASVTPMTPNPTSMTPPSPAPADPMRPTNLPPATGGPISKECQGFSFEGLVYSPGGIVLPNKCEAFHATLNNPWAVRCVDAWPWWKTDYAGDQYCILPPPPDKGMQIGHHPQGEGNAWFDAVSKGDMSKYKSPPPDWLVQPGGEQERNILIRHQATGGKYARMNNRMRGGSHHMIVSVVPGGGATFTWGPGGADGLFTGTGIPGAQRPDENSPQSENPPEENLGLYWTVAANPTVQYNMHHFNASDKPILKEAWQNIWYTDNPMTAIMPINGLPILQAIGTFAQPGQIVDMHYASTIPAPMRILGLFGHRHAWTTAFTAWVERPGMEPEIIYQSFDWFDEPTFQYNSEVINPKPAPDKKTDGAYSGILKLNAGDQLHFNCHIEYTEARAQAEKSPVTPSQNGPLRFANQAFEAEMCILFGAAIGDNGVMAQLGPPPAWTK